jgi:emfourin
VASLPPDDPITFERHGGFGGVVLRTTFTPSELSEPEADAIAAVQQGTAPDLRSPQPDRFEYHLDLPGGRVVIGEEDLPEPLRPLVTRLLERARRHS